MEFQENWQGTNPAQNNLTHFTSDEMTWNPKQTTLQSSDSDPKVTVTIPKSQLDFLNMHFPCNQLQSSDTVNTNEDEILVATPLENYLNPTIDTHTGPAIQSRVDSITSVTQQLSTDDLRSNLACTNTVKVKSSCLNGKALPVVRQDVGIETVVCKSKMTESSYTPMSAKCVIGQSMGIEHTEGNDNLIKSTTDIPMPCLVGQTTEMEHNGNVKESTIGKPVPWVVGQATGMVPGIVTTLPVVWVVGNTIPVTCAQHNGTLTESTISETSGLETDKLNGSMSFTNSTLPVTWVDSQTPRIEHNSNIHESISGSEASSDSFTMSSSDASSQSLENYTMKFRYKEVATKPNRSTKSLTFPPCNVCGGKASGLHYGVNTCEACKGFFRRYLLKKIEYKCNKSGQCDILKRSRGTNICSGCRLQKCLKLGMSKDRVQMGRYTSTKRTEAIMVMNKLKTEISETTRENLESETNPEDVEECSELIDKLCCMTLNLNQSEGFSLSLVEELKQAAIDMQPFGPDIVTDEQVEEALKSGFTKYKNMVDLFGEMKPASEEEYYKLYKDYSIDVDGRMQDLKEGTENVEEIATSYCKFAKHIPGFSKLANKDQTNLLKSARLDVYVLLMHKGFNRELGMALQTNGKAYHIDQYGDQFLSRDTCLKVLEVYERWQNLKLNKEEVALLMALVLMCPERCNLVKRHLVETIQQSLSELLMDWLRHTCVNRTEASKRFTKMIDVVTFSRQGIDLCLKEYNEMYTNPVLLQECPVLKQFVIDN